MLRAFAVLMVICRHPAFGPPEGPWGEFFQSLTRGGWVGVDLFFVLSGFLIGGLLLEELGRRGRLSLRRFWTRRGFKIWPCYFALVAYAFVVQFDQAGGTSSDKFDAALGRLWPNLIHVQNYRLTPLAHTWSLAIEEHFYLALPIFLAFLTWRADSGRPLPRPGVAACILVCAYLTIEGVYWAAIPLVLVMLIWAAGSSLEQRLSWIPLLSLLLTGACLGRRLYLCFVYESPWGGFNDTFTRVESLFLGVALRYVVMHRPSWTEPLRPYSTILVLGGLTCLLPAFLLEMWDTPWIPVYGLTLFSFASAALILAAWFASNPKVQPADAVRPPPIWVRLPAALGTISYSIFLWHVPLGHQLTYEIAAACWFPKNYFCRQTCFFIVSIGLGVLFYWLIERPGVRFRDRFFKAK